MESYGPDGDIDVYGAAFIEQFFQETKDELTKKYGREPDNVYFDGKIISWNTTSNSGKFRATEGIVQWTEEDFLGPISVEEQEVLMVRGKDCLCFRFGAEGVNNYVSASEPASFPPGVELFISAVTQRVHYVCLYVPERGEGIPLKDFYR